MGDISCVPTYLCPTVESWMPSKAAVFVDPRMESSFRRASSVSYSKTNQEKTNDDIACQLKKGIRQET